MSEAQMDIDANTPQSLIERLQESEVAFNVIAPIFSILFVTALGLLAASGFLRDATNRLVHRIARIGLNTAARTARAPPSQREPARDGGGQDREHDAGRHSIR